jgi:hypothetical protein
VVAAGGEKEQEGGRDEDPRSKDEKMALGDVNESLANVGWDVEKGMPPHRDRNQTAGAGAKQQPSMALPKSAATKWGKVRAVVQGNAAMEFVHKESVNKKREKEKKSKKKGSVRKIVKSNVENAWDIFLSYRVSAPVDLSLVRGAHVVRSCTVLCAPMQRKRAASFDNLAVSNGAPQVEKLYWRLSASEVKENGTTRRLRVFWDKQCLKAGEAWEQGFCSALCSSSVFVPIISRDTFVKGPLAEIPTDQDKDDENAPAKCDNVILEYELALVLVTLLDFWMNATANCAWCHCLLIAQYFW